MYIGSEFLEVFFFSGQITQCLLCHVTTDKTPEGDKRFSFTDKSVDCDLLYLRDTNECVEIMESAI